MNDIPSQLLAGGTAGSVSWWIICPFEAVKNRVQTMDVGKRPKHLWPFILDIYWNEGIRAFYREEMKRS
uniref:Uncharacterized protein n=1 Tax=Acrobeloides nanus TaxID=290746 RepID=A0A914EKP1_9BILA